MLTYIRKVEFFNKLVRQILKSILALYQSRIANLPNQWHVFGKVKVHYAGEAIMLYNECDDHIANDLYYWNNYEQQEGKLFATLAKSSSIIFDIGANTGILSIVAAKANPTAYIHSFEPQPSNFERLLKNI